MIVYTMYIIILCITATWNTVIPLGFSHWEIQISKLCHRKLISCNNPDHPEIDHQVQEYAHLPLLGKKVSGCHY